MINQGKILYNFIMQTRRRKRSSSMPKIRISRQSSSKRKVSRRQSRAKKRKVSRRQSRPKRTKVSRRQSRPKRKLTPKELSRTRTIYVLGSAPSSGTIVTGSTVRKVDVCGDKGFYSCESSPMCQWIGSYGNGRCI